MQGDQELISFQSFRSVYFKMATELNRVDQEWRCINKVYCVFESYVLLTWLSQTTDGDSADTVAC